jgi:hypothetical protein
MGEKPTSPADVYASANRSGTAVDNSPVTSSKDRRWRKGMEGKFKTLWPTDPNSRLPGERPV